MSQTIYIVTSGEYSDYGIEGVFSTKKKAQEAVDKIKASSRSVYDKPLIEPWTLDPLDSIREGYSLYNVNMNIDGSTINDAGASLGDPLARPEMEFYGAIPATQWLHVMLYAKSDVHALKIVNERRAQIIAANAWGKNKFLKEIAVVERAKGE